MATESEALRRDRADERSQIPLVTGIIVGILVIIAVVVATLAVVAWLDDDESAGFDVGVTLSDVTSDPEAYYGTDVTVSGEVNEVVGPRSFTIGGEGFLGGEELLVVSAADIEIPAELERGDDASVFEEDVVQVSGPVTEFVLVDVEEEAGLDLDDEAFADYEGQPAIVAQEVALNPRLEVPVGAITVEDIVDDEELFANQTVTLTGEVGTFVSAQSFLISDGSVDPVVVRDVGEQMLVVTSMDAMPGFLAESVPVEVSGTVRIYDPESAENDEATFEDEYDIEIEDGLLAGWEDDPVLIADSIVAAGANGAAIDITQLATDAFAYEGSQVATGGTVEEVLTDQTFVLTNEDENDPVDVEVLVVAAGDIMADAVVPEAFAHVAGTVYIWDDEFESEVGGQFPFLFEDDEIFDDFDGSVVIAADSMNVER